MSLIFAMSNFDAKVMKAFTTIKKKKKDEGFTSNANIVVVIVPPPLKSIVVPAKEPAKTKEVGTG